MFLCMMIKKDDLERLVPSTRKQGRHTGITVCLSTTICKLFSKIMFAFC